MLFRNKSFLLLLLSISLISLSGCKNNGIDELTATQELYGTILGDSFGCPDAPPFSTLAAAGTVPTCTACHGSPTSGGAPFTITDYTATVARVVPGDPAGSLLYQKITSGGTMQIHTTPSITRAIECWIAGGANP